MAKIIHLTDDKDILNNNHFLYSNIYQSDQIKSEDMSRMTGEVRDKLRRKNRIHKIAKRKTGKYFRKKEMKQL